MTSSRAVAFDFDGVLADTADEILVTAYNAVTGNRSCLLSEVPHEAYLFFKQWHEHALNAADMMSLLGLWADGFTGEVTRELLQSYSKGIEQELVSKLFKTRGELIALDCRAWASLTTPFQPLWEAVCKNRWGKPIIVTNKDGASVKAICNHHGMDLSQATLLSGDPNERGVVLSKRARIASVLEQHKDLIFLEDSWPHLAGVLDLPGLSAGLVLWGPVSEGDKKAARDAGVPLLPLLGAVDFLDSWLTAAVK
jgi:FMN phosphatase YigB (HAD superfamily)